MIEKPISRPVEDYVLDKIDEGQKKRIGEFFDSLTPRELAVVAAYADGMNLSEIADGFGRERNTIWETVNRARDKAIIVFGEEALIDRKKKTSRRTFTKSGEIYLRTELMK